MPQLESGALGLRVCCTYNVSRWSSTALTALIPRIRFLFPSQVTRKTKRCDLVYRVDAQRFWRLRRVNIVVSLDRIITTTRVRILCRASWCGFFTDPRSRWEVEGVTHLWCLNSQGNCATHFRRSILQQVRIVGSIFDLC